jgi:hypothetical protein
MLLMQADSGTNMWDMTTMWDSHSRAAEAFSFFLLVAFVVALVKLVRTWRGAPPFVYLKRTLRPTYFVELRALRTSLGQWIGLVLLAWGAVTAAEAGRICYDILVTHRVETILMTFEARNLVGMFQGAMWAALALYFVRWSVIRRMERLGP